ncbi:MAG: Fe-S protein, partial [Burkholderiales bacterium RIFCSPHIGHO2_12_FULL_67_38]
MAGIHISDIEAAINYWRERSPSSDGLSLADPVRALAELYARMAYRHETEIEEASLSQPAREAWLAWFQTTPDTPCIAICSTSQGDAVCKGCGRSFDEVQRWTEMTPGEKRASWRRIT